MLINSCLDNIASYVMGLYLLLDGIHHKLDMSRAKFYWKGSGDQHKYHMV
jgi:hypothetical protein